MPTIGQVYNPIVEAAVAGDPRGHALLAELADALAQRNPGKTSEQCLVQARINLDYYCQYFSAKTAAKVKEFYGLGQGFMALSGQKLG